MRQLRVLFSAMKQHYQVRSSDESLASLLSRTCCLDYSSRLSTLIPFLALKIRIGRSYEAASMPRLGSSTNSRGSLRTHATQ